ncbi:MAG: hypothetical protein ACRDX9_03745 [Acidimicrobiia bacterium]
MTDTTTERHPFRFLFKLLLIVGALAAVSKVVASKSKDFQGLTESEARAKFESKLGPRIGSDKAAEVADQVIPRLKEKGMIKSDAEQAVDDAKDVAAEATDKVVDSAKDAGKSMKDAVEKIEEKID